MDIRSIWFTEAEYCNSSISKLMLKGDGYAVIVQGAYSVHRDFQVDFTMLDTTPVTLLPILATPLAASENWHEGFGAGEPIGTFPSDTRSADRLRTMRNGWGPVRAWLYWSMYRRWFPEPYEEPAPWPGVPAELSLSTFAVSMTQSVEPMLVLASGFRVTPDELVFFVRMVDGEHRYDYDHIRVSRNVVTHDMMPACRSSR